MVAQTAAEDMVGVGRGEGEGELQVEEEAVLDGRVWLARADGVDARMRVKANEIGLWVADRTGERDEEGAQLGI